MGCGRIPDGAAPAMWASLQRLAALPPETQVYCGHEYTEANARFALTVDPGNAELQKRYETVKALRAANRQTLPTTIGLELKTNPFPAGRYAGTSPRHRPALRAGGRGIRRNPPPKGRIPVADMRTAARRPAPAPAPERPRVNPASQKTVDREHR